MIDKYYKEQLEILRNHSKLFSQRYPALAPMLAESGSDPDVERLLEGTAYLSARIQQRLENGVPELIQSLLRLTFPDVLNPIPSTTLIQFFNNPGFNNSIKVEAGTSINSIMVGETSCLYNTEFDLDLLPIKVKCLGVQQTETNQAKVVIKIDSSGDNFKSVFSKKNDYTLRLHCGGEYSKAVARFQTILEHTEHIELYQGYNNSTNLNLASKKILPTRKHLKISDNCFRNNQLPFNINYEMGVNLGEVNRYQQHILALKRYLHLPQQLLFLDIFNLTPNIFNNENANSFELHFVLNKNATSLSSLPDFSADSFLTNVVSAVNVFEQSADPLVVDQTREEYAIRPQDAKQKSLEIIHITKVEALLTGGKIQKFYPFELFTPNLNKNLYSVRYKVVDNYLNALNYSKNRQSGNNNFEKNENTNINNNIGSSQIADGKRFNIIYLLTLLQAPKTEFTKQTLSINLICCNHTLPKQLRVGDICLETDNSPSQATFRNIVNPTAPIGRIVDTNLLWRFVSLLSCNLLSLASLESLKSLLYLYLPNETNMQDVVTANKKRIEALLEFRTRIAERLYKGNILQGRNLYITIEETNFLNRGDLYLFAVVLDSFLAGFAPINSYTQLFIKIIPSGEIIEFAPHLGSKKLF